MAVIVALATVICGCPSNQEFLALEVLPLPYASAPASKRFDNKWAYQDVIICFNLTLDKRKNHCIQVLIGYALFPPCVLLIITPRHFPSVKAFNPRRPHWSRHRHPRHRRPTASVAPLRWLSPHQTPPRQYPLVPHARCVPKPSLQLQEHEV